MLVLSSLQIESILWKLKSLSHVWLFVTPWTLAPQTPLPMGILQAKILEWVSCPFSRGSSWPRNQTRVSWVADRFFTIWATGEAPVLWIRFYYPSFTKKEAERSSYVRATTQSRSSPVPESMRLLSGTYWQYCKSNPTSQSRLAVTIINLYHYLLPTPQLSFLSYCVSLCRQNGTRSVLWIVRRWLIWKI